MDWARKWPVDFSAGKAQLISFAWSNDTGAIDVKMDGSVLDSGMRWVWSVSSKFLSPVVALYLYKLTM